MKRNTYYILSFVALLSCIQVIYADQETATLNIEKNAKSAYESRIEYQNKLLQIDKKSGIILEELKKLGEIRNNFKELDGSEESSDELKESFDELDENSEKLEVLEKEIGKGKNYQELKTLTDNGIVITPESLEDLENNFNFAAIKVNLFEGENLRHALISALESIRKGVKNNFIIGENNVLDRVKNTNTVMDAITNLQNFLAKMNMENIDEQSKACELLQNVIDALNSSEIGINNPFGKFISGILKIYQTEATRRAADDIMLKLRPSVEQSLDTNVSTTSASLGVQGNVNGVSIGGSVGVSKSGDAKFSNFYSISKTKKVELTFGSGFFEKLVNLKASVGASITNMAVFNSIEQLMDSGEKIPTLQFSAVKDMVNSRKKMQRAERKLLALFRNNVKSFFKMIQIIPVSTYVEWPSITRASKANEVRLTGVDASGTASLMDLGFTVKVAKNKMDVQSSRGYITLLNPDCSSAVYDPTYPLNFVGVGYDYSYRYITTNFSQEKYNLSNLLVKEDTSLQNGSTQLLEVAINTVLGDLRRYNDILSSLAGIADEIEELKEKAEKDKEIQAQIKNLKKELDNLEESKHEIEKRWKKSKSLPEGREGVLKSMVVTLNRLRAKATTNREIELFKQSYIELKRLTQLHEFSKNKNKQASFKTTVSKYISAITYVLSLPGGASVTFLNNHGKLPDWDVTVSLPTTIGGILAKELILKKMEEISRGLGQKPSKDVDKGLINAVQITGSILADQLSNIPSVPLPSGSTSIGYSGVTTVNIGIKKLTPSTSSLKPLPKDNLVSLPGTKYSVMYTQIQTTSNFNLKGKINAGLAAINASISQAVGKKVWLGGDWFYWSSKYNAFADGLKDKTPATKVNTPWITLTNNQAQQLQKFLMEVNYSDLIRFELQESYNNMLGKAKNNPEKVKEVESAYEKLLAKSRALTDSTSSSNYKEALDAFNKVLELNFQSLTW